MTLDEATERFEAQATRETASDLRRVAREYYLDGMIADITYAHLSRRVHKALSDIAHGRNNQ